MSKFKVETSELKASANSLEEKNATYIAEYGKLYAAIAGLKVDWQGKTSTAFNTKVESYRQSFEELAQLVASYIEFLRKTASDYEATEDALSDALSRLGGLN